MAAAPASGSESIDLQPTPKQQRTLSGWEMATMWASIVVNIPGYYLVGSLVDLGMSWWEGVATVVAGNAIITVCLVLSGHLGSRYGIPFPVLARSAFGVHGAHIATLLRSLIACGWFAIDSWVGGQAIFILLPSSLRQSSALARTIAWLGTSPLEFTCFIVFWLIQLMMLWKGMAGIRWLGKYSAPVLIVFLLWLLGWAYVNAGGFGNMLALPSRLSPLQFWAIFLPCLTANISNWSGVVLNISDFTRYAKTETDQILGQVGLPIFMGAYAFAGLAITSSTEVIFGHVISNPIMLLGEIGGGVVFKIVAVFGISLAIITTNVPSNIVAAANSLVNLSPKFNFSTAALLTSVVGVVFQPWRILQSSENFVYAWLGGCSGLSAPVLAVILVDYLLLRRTILDIDSLYSVSPVGTYYYYQGFNPGALAAVVIGIAPVLPGFLNKVGFLQETAGAFVFFYKIAWLVSFFAAGSTFWCISYFTRTRDTASSCEPLLASV